MDDQTSSAELLEDRSHAKRALLGVAGGVGAASCWALGFVATRHGLKAGLTPADLLMHRFLWSGLAFLPIVVRAGLRDLGGIGWGRGLVLMVLGGPVMSIISYTGFLFGPLGHGSVIQPSCATLGGLFLAATLLRERIAISRAIGAFIIGSESIGHIGGSAVHGDLIFVLTGFMFAGFGTLLRRWSIPAWPAATIISVLSLLLFPVYAATGGIHRLFAAGFGESCRPSEREFWPLQRPSVCSHFRSRSSALEGPPCFRRSCPALTLLAGWILLDEVPTGLQATGLVTVLLGFYLAQRQR